jgi:hypothetical protein
MRLLFHGGSALYSGGWQVDRAVATPAVDLPDSCSTLIRADRARVAARRAYGGSERTLGTTAYRPRRRKHAAYLHRVCVSADARTRCVAPLELGAGTFLVHAMQTGNNLCVYGCKHWKDILSSLENVLLHKKFKHYIRPLLN